jgi:hypothetical protein
VILVGLGASIWGAMSFSFHPYTLATHTWHREERSVVAMNTQSVRSIGKFVAKLAVEAGLIVAAVTLDQAVRTFVSQKIRAFYKKPEDKDIKVEQKPASARTEILVERTDGAQKFVSLEEKSEQTTPPIAPVAKTESEDTVQ